VIVDSYLATAQVAAALLREPGIGHHWSDSSALPEYRISGLAGHLASATVLRVAEALDAEVPDQEPVDAVQYFASAYVPGPSPHHPAHQRIRGIAEDVAADGQDDLLGRFDATLGDLARRLPTESPDRLVFATQRVLRLDQWLLTRLIELAVHMDDLAVSVDVETPTLPPEAGDLVLTALVRIAAAHYGEVPVLRSLSRRERAAVTISAF
jgi:hypothetical protein